jgi:hypothetical protein
MELMVAERLKPKEGEWRKEFEEKIQVFKERCLVLTSSEHSLERQTAQLKSELASLRQQSKTQVLSI